MENEKCSLPKDREEGNRDKKCMKWVKKNEMVDLPTANNVNNYVKYK